MLPKVSLALFLTFLVLLVVAADQGRIPEALSGYRMIPYGDTAGHFILMGLFSFLATLVLKGRFLKLGRCRVPLGAALVLVVVALEECSQAFIPARTFSLLDFAADFIGITVFGWLAVRLWPAGLRDRTR